MCGYQDDEEDRAVEPDVPLAALIERTRAVEACKPGDRVPEALWAIFFGSESGAIPWGHYERMLVSRQTAVALITASAASRRRFTRPARRSCIAIEPAA
jgi:hypothetical protein